MPIDGVCFCREWLDITDKEAYNAELTTSQDIENDEITVYQDIWLPNERIRFQQNK